MKNLNCSDLEKQQAMQLRAILDTLGIDSNVIQKAFMQKADPHLDWSVHETIQILAFGSLFSAAYKCQEDLFKPSLN